VGERVTSHPDTPLQIRLISAYVQDYGVWSDFSDFVLLLPALLFLTGRNSDAIREVRKDTYFGVPGPCPPLYDFELAWRWIVSMTGIAVIPERTRQGSQKRKQE